MFRCALAAMLLLCSADALAAPLSRFARAPVEVGERITDLPETGMGWHLSIFMPPDWKQDAELKQVVSWFATEPRLAKLNQQTHSHLYTTDDPLYASGHFSRAIQRVPSILIQDAKGVPRCKVGNSTMIPGTGAELADGIASSLAAMDDGEVGRLFNWLRPRPRPRPRPFCDGDCKPKPTPDDDSGPTPNPPDLPFIPDIFGVPPDVPDVPDIPDTPIVPPPPPEHNHDAINAKLAELAVLIKAIPAGADGAKGEPGKPGTPGEPGQPGAKGDPGISPTVDEVVEAVIARLPPLPVRSIYMKHKGDPDPQPATGGESDWVPYREQVDDVYFSKGEGITIRLFPPD